MGAHPEKLHKPTQEEKELNAMTRDEMLTRMIQLFGFEHKKTIHFAQLMERDDISDKELEAVLNYNRVCLVLDEDEEEDE